MLVIFDGLGLSLPGPGNAFFVADPQNFKDLQKTYPHTLLTASGESVGLPKNEAGSTEVGHLNITAGRIVFQSLPRINLSIADGSFYMNQAFLEATKHVEVQRSAIHLIGLLGQGSIHSHKDHLYALLNLMKEQNMTNVYVHVIGDGRDSPPQKIKEYLTELEEKMHEIGVGKIASVMGRFYGMDRDNRWDRIEKAYNMLTLGEGAKAQSWQDAVEQAYKNNIFDEFIEPTNIVDQSGKPVCLIQDNDSVIFYNFRIDRPRELTKAFVLNNFERLEFHRKYQTSDQKNIQNTDNKSQEVTTFKRKKIIQNLVFVTMTEYEKGLPVKVAFPSISIDNSLGEVVAKKGLKQLRLAESEKERFVTIYFNGMHDTVYDGEVRDIVPSPSVPTYDLKPEMSAHEITEKLVNAISSEQYKLIVVNYANADMLGHTGNFEGCLQAIKVLDECLKPIIDTTLQHDYTMLITADHGNVEEMVNPTTGSVSTEHTNNPVPFVVVDPRVKDKPLELEPGILGDVAPTVLFLLGIPKPIDMTGRNLVEGISELQSF